MSPPHETLLARSSRERPPRLVLLFAVLTALSVAAAAAVILVVVRQADVLQAHAHAIDRARFAARAVLAPELRPADMATAPPATRRRQLDSVFRRRVLLEGIRAATLFGPDGRPTYSSPGARVAHESTGVYVREALSGTTVSQLVTVEDGSRVLNTYVPIGPANGAHGVVRIDQRYEPVAASVRQSSWLIAGVLEGLLVVLFLVFVPLLAKAAAKIRTHVAELEQIATHDELTGLANRYGFRREAVAALARSQSSAILLVDLDGFSEINAFLGVANGDDLLTEAGERIRRAVDPDRTLVARLGDDEFGVLLGDADEGEAERVCEELRRSFVPPFLIGSTRAAVSIDVGVGLFPEHGSDLETVLGCASAALSRAKGEDQSSIQVYRSTLGATDKSRVEVVAELRDALDADQLLVFYQPQADLLTQRVRGVEALLRWEHPERGLLTAGEFISHAERGGLGQELRRFVVRTAARQWLNWQELGLDLELAINLSTVDVFDPALPDEIADTISRYDIPPWNVVLEVTERTLIGDERRARAVAERLRRIGVRLSIDDFGTGYSSLASLRRFPIHQVKLDQSLFADVPGDEGAEAIVGGCFEIAHGLGALVVAEGIETRQQLRFAYAMGCDIAQGYLIGRPVPPDELLAVLDAPRLIPLSVA